MVTAIAVTALALLGCPAAALATPVEWPLHYVALGDSYASGPWIPEQRTDPAGCLRSTRNYPARLAAALGLRDYTDVSCGGARTGNMTAAQPVRPGPNPPQFDALRPDTDLVTLTIGSNDIDLGGFWITCTRLGVTDPFGDPCERQATADGTDRYAQRIAATAHKVARVLEGIRERSPRATIVLVAYLRLLPPILGCFPAFPIALGDVPYADGVQRRLTAMLARQESEHGAVFVDAYAASVGHDACEPRGRKWVEGSTPTSPAYPDHPNALGMHEVADLTLSTLRTSTATP